MSQCSDVIVVFLFFLVHQKKKVCSGLQAFAVVVAHARCSAPDANMLLERQESQVHVRHFVFHELFVTRPLLVGLLCYHILTFFFFFFFLKTYEHRQTCFKTPGVWDVPICFHIGCTSALHLCASPACLFLHQFFLDVFLSGSWRHFVARWSSCHTTRHRTAHAAVSAAMSKVWSCSNQQKTTDEQTQMSCSENNAQGKT